jgi:16S rRNA (cytosine967-C5)-methyltransferase
MDIMDKVTHSRIPMDSVVGDYMRRRRYIGAKDRANIAARVYDMMRHYARVGWWLEKSNREDNARNRMIIWLHFIEKQPDYAPLESLFDGTQYGPRPLDAEELKYLGFLRRGDDYMPDEMPEDIRAECPPMHYESLKNYFGDDFVPELSALMEGAHLDLRVNHAKASLEDVQEQLKQAGIETVKTEYAPHGLRVGEKIYLAKTKSFLKGWVEIQDEGSQLIAAACDAQPGMQVLDYCAGGGGKTLALAAAMANKGRIVAMDTDAGRMAKSNPRLKKAGVRDIVEMRPLSDETNRKWLRRQKGNFDLVLLDVPCSGTGTWRRNPDMRWRTYGPSLEDLLVVQAEILERAHKAVKPGGRLVYATCSLLPEENERQVEAFLKAHDDFKLVKPPESVPSQDNMMRLTPHRHSTDGFFAACMVRDADAVIEGRRKQPMRIKASEMKKGGGKESDVSKILPPQDD